MTTTVITGIVAVSVMCLVFTYLCMYALLLPLEHRPQITRLRPVRALIFSP